LILQSHPSDALAIAGNKDKAPTFRFVEVNGFDEVFGNAIVLQPLGATNQDFCAANVRLDAATGSF
jgi:hypothetical protein